MFLWSQIKSDSSSGSWLHLPGVLIEDMAPTFDTPGDDMPCKWDGCRNKDIHSIGVISKVKFQTFPSPFSGIFKGADYGLVRHSTAAPYNTKGTNIKPGLGLKLLRDGVDSGNMVSSPGVDGQDDWNFFANDWSNHISQSKSKALIPLEIIFTTATDFVQAVGLSDMATYDKTGAKTDPAIFPFSLRFEPTTQFNWSSTFTEDPLEQLMKMPSGSEIWKIYGLDAPKELGGQEHLVGSLVTTSETVKSFYGDDMLLIRHQRVEDDIKLKPEWTNSYPKYPGVFGNNMGEGCNYFESKEHTMEYSCPFAFLLL